jgi:copper chaperone NosL
MLWAPQYPEGLMMKIWYNKLSGSIDIINGLNHYIGMKHISVEMFPEFGFIGILLGVLIAVGLAAAISGRARILLSFIVLSIVYGIAALWDFWRWGYDYGHHLDPTAAIKVEGMAYQPPVLGYKNLLNFTAYSGPDTGAWIIIGVCSMAMVLWGWEYFKNKKAKPDNMKSNGTLIVAALAITTFFGCSTGPEPIRYGKDGCVACKMTLTDKRFGAEIVTQKGKVFIFDDLNCLTGYLNAGTVAEKDIAQIVIVDFKNTGAFVDVQKSFFLQNDAIKSPMRGDVASFSTPQDRDAVKAEIGGGAEMNWEAVQKLF